MSIFNIGTVITMKTVLWMLSLASLDLSAFKQEILLV